MPEKERQKEDAPEEEPQVYTVQKDMNGWQFSRRAFLTAAGAGAAVAAVGTVASCGESQEPEVVTRIVVQEVTVSSDSAPTATDAPVSTDMPAATDTVAPTDTATPTETATPTNTATPSKTPTPTNTPTDTATPTPAVPKAQFVKDITIPDGTVMKPAQPFTKTWRFKNVGAVPWGKGVTLAFVPGEHKGFESKKMAGPDAVDVPSVAPGKSVDVSVDLVSPQKLGQHRSYWRLKLGNGEWLENIHYADIFVASPQPIAETIDPGKEGVEFQVKKEGKWVTWTQPCGMPIPPGAVCVCNCVAAPLPGSEGSVPPGQEGGTITGPGGETRWLPCNSPIPPGWTCTCNCVSPCSCDGACSCDGHKQRCTCDAVHYWYPN
jgi:hypothetical protein